MTSKAERRRRHRAVQKIRHLQRQEEAAADAPLPWTLPPVAFQTDDERTRAPGAMTEKQEAAWGWFHRLRRDLAGGGVAGSAARTQLDAIKLQISDDEYDILCELCRDTGRIPHRVGRSRHKVRELEMSALRKLVIYRHTNGLDDEAS